MKKSIIRMIIILFFVSIMVLISIFFYQKSTAQNMKNSKGRTNNTKNSYEWIVEKVQLLEKDKIILTE